MTKKLLELLNIAVLCVVIFFVSTHFVEQAWLVGYVLLVLALGCLLTLRFYKIKIKNVYPDVVFGIIDNGILALMALFGGEIAGVFGAVIGGVVGNAITDGIAGMFEGYWAERYSVKNRTVLGSSVGKMAGCLLGAGVVLIVAQLFDFHKVF